MGPDPNSLPAFGSQSAAQNSAALGRAVGQTAPLAPQWHGVQAGPAPQQVFNQAAAPKSSGVVSTFTHFLGNIGSEIGHIAGGAAKWLGHNLADAAVQPVHFVQGIDHVIQDNSDINQTTAWTKQAADKLNSLHDMYKSGRINKIQYQQGLSDLGKFQNTITEKQMGLDKRIASDKAAFIKASIGTEADVITIMTAGLGRVAAAGADALPVGERAAATFLSSHAPSALLDGAEQGIKHLASNPQLFEALSPTAQKAIQAATAEVVANSTSMAAKQIARTAAVNLALKYPIYFNMINPQGQEIYNKLDSKQYGSAVQQMGFNALLLLSGGPIGQALKYGGKFFGAAKLGAFGQSSFLDELSKGIGDGTPTGLYDAIMSIKNPEVRADIIKNMSAVEATNLQAVTGKDPVAAAWRVLSGMASYEGISMSSFTHEEALTNMVNFARAQRIADTIAETKGLGPITVGRLDARTLDIVRKGLAPAIADGKDSANKVLNSMLAANKGQAWANNDNFIRQLRSLIEKYDNPEKLDKAIREIRAGFTIPGFPLKEAKQLSKMGYVAIKPTNLRAPFKEGTGKLITHAAEQSDDFFLKAVKPLPILGSAGSLLMHMGLSPTASVGRVYEMFNAGLADNVSNLHFIDRAVSKGASSSEKADILIKRLSNYAHDPNTFLQRAAPITDLRQMTTGDIMKAIPGLSKSEAKEVKGAIMDAMLQVPLTLRGLGDKLVDINYKINPTQKAYLRIQGGARFAWNPFFQAKLAYKTELLTQAQAQGHFPTLLGTNHILSMIFPDKYNQLDEVRNVLRGAGMFDRKVAHFGQGLSGEAVNDAGAAGANLTHKLLPGQERSIAGLISVQADKVGLSVEDFVKYNKQNVADTVQMIGQYDRRSEFLNSAMARTLNLAFFPFRFEYKVGSIMARSLAQTSMMTQLAVINGLYRGDKWLNSPEGMAWYSNNSQVIQLLKYFTPIQTLGEVAGLLGMHPDSIGSFGEIGGLPFGWLPQLLDAQGLTNFGGVYVSPTTGKTIPKYVPITDKGRLTAAIQDLIGSLFTYPGTTAGLPSKTSIVRNISMGVTGATKKDDYNKVDQPIPEDKMNFSQAVQQAQAQRQQQQGQPPTPPENQPIRGNLATPPRPGTQIPIAPLNLPPGKTSSKSSGGKTKKLKKADFKPELLPGQTRYGQVGP